MNSNFTTNSTEILCDDTLNSTIAMINSEIDFIDIIPSPYFYGSTIIFIILLLCVLTFIFILKSRKKFLFPK